jgi:hypothetical protein
LKKTIFVVEGQTEQIFLVRFLEQLVALLPCHIQRQQLRGGVLYDLTSRGNAQADQCNHHIRIIDAGNDEKVNSFIEENLLNFKGKGYGTVCGLRDQYTGDKNKTKIDVAALHEITKGWSEKMKVLVQIIVAVEEIEAWFFCVPEFFATYHPSLTIAAVNGILHINLPDDPVESIKHPSAAITKVLASVKHVYKKRAEDAYTIVDRLDFDALYNDKATNVAALGQLVEALDNAVGG